MTRVLAAGPGVRVPSRAQLIRRHPVAGYNPLLLWSFIGVIVLAPLMLTSYWLFVFSQVLIVTVIAAGMNVIVGNAGQLALSSVAFYALGAYGYAWLSEQVGSIVIGLVLAVALVTGAATAVGWLALRLQGLYLAIVTFGLIFVAHDMVINQVDFTGGAVGMGVAERGGADNRFVAYALIAGSVLIITGICATMKRTSFGRALEAIRQCEDAAAAFGVSRLRYVLIAFVFSSVCAGVAGALYAVTIGYLSPEPFTVHATLIHLTVIVVGGLGTVIGPLVGSAFISLINELLRGYPAVQEILYGLLLLTFLLFIRGGVVGVLSSLARRVKGRFRRASTDGGPTS